MVRRHHHDHGRPHVLGLATTFGAHLGTEVRRGDDHWNAPPDLFQDLPGQDEPFFIGEKKLLGEVGENAETVGACVDHEVHAPPLTGDIELAALGEGGGDNGEDAFVAFDGHELHPQAKENRFWRELGLSGRTSGSVRDAVNQVRASAVSVAHQLGRPA